ncbi:MAG TPA: hypothetical protein VLF89_03615 [Candidatus Saccharimonadales bacterium]|nr:hypothetical protein [Candidatus Saccharimonadales bacterium]
MNKNLLVNIDGINFYAHSLCDMDKDAAISEIMTAAGIKDKKWAKEAYERVMAEWNGNKAEEKPV